MDPNFTCFDYQSTSGALSLIVKCNSRITEMQSGLFHNPYLSLSCDGISPTYQFQVFLCSIESGLANIENVSALLQQLLPNSGYTACPGI